MVELGLRYESGPVFLKNIAKAEEISEKYLSQIVIPLKSAGLVNSFRGAHGGYVLAKPPQEITMKDIVGVLEGGFNLTGRPKNAAERHRVTTWVTHELWDDLGQMMEKMLDGVTLKDLINRCKDKKQSSVMYNI